MNKQSVFIATSLDGFIARPDGNIDWLTKEKPSAVEDYGYSNFIASIDALVMGRHSFEKVLSFDQWPYKNKVIVLSTQSLDIPNRLQKQVNHLSGSPEEIVDQLAEEGYEHLYIDGGKTIQQFLRAGFIQEMTITQIPVLIGEGIPLFGPVEKDIKLNHVMTKSFDNGFVQSRYAVNHDES